MRTQIFVLTVLILFVASSMVEAETTTIKVLGKNPLIKEGVASAGDLREKLKNQKNDVLAGFQKVGYGQLFEPMMKQIDTTEITKIEFKTWDTLKWMIYKKNNQAEAISDVAWGGAKAFKAFQFSIYNNGECYTFVVPAICGNISLYKINEHKPPKCAVKGIKEQVCQGETITADASGSNSPEGGISRVSFNVVNNAGQTVFSKTTGQGILTMEIPMNFPAGKYTIVSVVSDSCGATDECSATTVILGKNDPVCNLTVDDKKVCKGDTITADASASSDKDNNIASVTFKVVNASGQAVFSETVNKAPWIKQIPMDFAEGKYDIVAVVRDSCGATAECSVAVEVGNEPPISKLTMNTDTIRAGSTFTADARESSDPDGEIVSVSFNIVNTATGQTVPGEVIEESESVRQIRMAKAGNYRVNATVIDNCGATATSTADLSVYKPLLFLFDLGIARQFDPANYVPVRVGMEYRIDQNWSVIGLVGGYYKFDGHEGESAFTIDGLLNYSFRNGFFAGVGAGAWITDGDDDIEHENSQVDLIFNVGQRIWGDYYGMNASLFLEVRSGFDEFGDIDKIGRLALGLRMKF